MDPQKLSAQELVQLCLASQDPALWCEFVRRFQPPISRAVLKSLRRWPSIHAEPALVDDLTQDTFMKLFANDYRALREFKFEHEAQFYGFLKIVASNVVHDYVRKIHNDKRGGGRQEEDFEEIACTVPAPRNSSQDPERQVLLAQIQRCLENLLRDDPHGDRDMTLFLLYFRVGFTAEAISRYPHFGLEIKGVESALLRLVRLVRARCLGEPGRKGAAGG